ncbi:protein-L-isoaspartate(D-aspartate) O-methyltransferase [Agromyces mangrovi Wang et al. 2018]|uniref:protein-L-isoaspartate(D-aspartate) O-methyltransferase n=1 Tax=Agromyces mangrovi TaxID=1858653 RepID=UPI002573E5FD|nr:protein-L-isoaspartate(D-aspartate) O-methyltransferase [Agromyces mangrovi]
MTDRSAEREDMIAWHLEPRGIREPAVLDAMRAVPREAFLPARLRGEAYADHPLPIGDGQTISQPYVVALTAQAARIRPGDRVLEVGTGSGYAAAVLARLAGEVWSVERVPGLAAGAVDALAAAGVRNVHVVTGDGTLGLPDHAPFDAIVAAAAGPDVPLPWLDQLADGGCIVMPLEQGGGQHLVRVTRPGTGEPVIERLESVRFVPLVGEHGWHRDDRS